MVYEHPVYTHRSLAAQAELPRLQGIQRSGRPGGDVAEAATPGADLAHQHHGRRPSTPAFADVGAARFLAHGVQVQLAQRALDVLVPPSARHADLEPVRLGLAGARPRGAAASVRAPDLHQARHERAYITETPWKREP